MNINFKKVLVLAPHADDCELGTAECMHAGFSKDTLKTDNKKSLVIKLDFRII